MPRPGIFLIPPKQGPAYFSLWDNLTGQCRPAPPKSGYSPFAINAWPLFDADWRYVDGIDPIVRTPFQNHTIGSRWAGDKDGWLWDFEGALQFGEQNDNDLFAGMATAGLGRNWKDSCLMPTLWVYYDHAANLECDDSDDRFRVGHFSETGTFTTFSRQSANDWAVERIPIVSNE